MAAIESAWVTRWTLIGWAAFLAASPGIAPLAAHPMPDTEIEVQRSADRVQLNLRLPASDLALALPAATFDADGRLDRQEEEALNAYFLRHSAVSSTDGQAYPLSIEGIKLTRSVHDDVGTYRELEVRLSAPVPGDSSLVLGYDGIMHRVANHRALVRSDAGEPLGVIRYSLAERVTNPISLAPASTSIADPRASPAEPRSKGAANGKWQVLAAITIVTAFGLVIWLLLRSDRKWR